MTISTTVVPSLFYLKVIFVSVTYVRPRDKSEVAILYQANLSYHKTWVDQNRSTSSKQMLITSTLSHQPKAAIQLGFQ